MLNVIYNLSSVCTGGFWVGIVEIQYGTRKRGVWGAAAPHKEEEQAGVGGRQPPIKRK